MLIIYYVMVHRELFFIAVEVVRQLLNRGGDPNIHHEGFTPLMALSSSTSRHSADRLQCLKSLLKAKADVNTTNKLKETALMFASKTQQSDFVLELLEHQACIDFTDCQEWTALFYAVASNNVHNVEVLLKWGTDSTLKTYDALSVYDVAVAKGHEKLITLLNSNCPGKCQNINVHATMFWTDLFPNLIKLRPDEVDCNVEGILYGMGLSCYNKLFYGMNLSQFLTLEEKDLVLLEINLKLHRKKFIEGLVRFHKHEWSSNVVKLNVTQEYISLNTIKLLGNISYQLCIMSSSLYFLINYRSQVEENQQSHLTYLNKTKIMEEVTNILIVVQKIRDSILNIRTILYCMNKQNSNLCLPIFITKKTKKHKSCLWMVVIISVASTYLLLKKAVKC
ncbi:uncharacterized protein LOC106641891 isoform X2 [Copidosoma floridanum]|uniref:uncharacterized protein LOC106641891 isoform X2 n=1 Tax=Copidosoma floridanum TaxID=29053 RepID=UPI0006C981BA|nr:uncharacterized protein LOC106641891 isoform X2 [Copidosoma floridanum]